MHSRIAITLKYQYDHIEDSVLIYSCDECAVYLVADEEKHPGSFVKLNFDHARCVRSARTECSPTIGVYPTESGVSFIVELTDSKWPVEAHNLYTYSNSKPKPRGRHFVISSHDIFHEILAESFNEHIVNPGSSEHEIIKYHFSQQSRANA